MVTRVFCHVFSAQQVTYKWLSLTLGVHVNTAKQWVLLRLLTLRRNADVVTGPADQ